MKKLLSLILFVIFSFNSSVYSASDELTLKMVVNMRFGKTNNDVKFLQQTLYDFGYFKSEEDEPKFSGKFDKELKDALIDFQKTNSIKVTGDVNFETYKTLREFLSFRDEQEQEFINKNPYVDENENSTLNQYQTDIVDAYSAKDNELISYYSDIPGIATVKKIISNVFSTSNPKKDEGKKKDIFDCFLDPVCSRIK